MAEAAAVIGLVGLVLSVKQAEEAEEAQEEVAEIQARTAERQNARQRRQQVAQARIARAATIAQGEAQGISGGSQVSGAAGSVQTQAAANISFSQQLEGLDRARFNALGRVGTLQRRTETTRAVSSFALNFA